MEKFRKLIILSRISFYILSFVIVPQPKNCCITANWVMRAQLHVGARKRRMFVLQITQKVQKCTNCVQDFKPEDSFVKFCFFFVS